MFDLDQAIACLFGRVLIYKATGESSHLITVESLDLFKLTRGYAIATVFAEKNRNGRISEHVGQGFIAGSLYVVAIAPAVRVETKKVRRRLILVVNTLHVSPGILQNFADIGSRITDRYGTVDMVFDVVFHVTLNCTDVLWVELGSRQIVHNLVGGEEAKCVWEVLEVLNDSKGAIKIAAVVACPWFSAVDALAWQGRVDVEHHVNASGIEDGGTLGVIESGIKIVDTKRVHAKPLHEDCISQTEVGIAQGILFVGRLICALSSGLVVDTNYHKALASNSVDEVAAANFNGIDSMAKI